MGSLQIGGCGDPFAIAPSDAAAPSEHDDR
jgi:hypothetical protein